MPSVAAAPLRSRATMSRSHIAKAFQLKSESHQQACMSLDAAFQQPCAHPDAIRCGEVAEVALRAGAGPNRNLAGALR